jgi:acetyltransferase-like isoleucine patch superfamily enzyme
MLRRFLKVILGTGPRIHNWIVLRMNGVKTGKNLVINGLIQVSNHGTLVIGDDVTINSGVRHNPIGGHTKTVLMVYPGATLTIGDGVGISNSTIAAQERITIGDGALIGGGCEIWDTDFHSLDSELRGTSADRGVSRTVHIGKKAFVGARSIVLKGSQIGDRAIVGAGSVGSFKLTNDQLYPPRRPKDES